MYSQLNTLPWEEARKNDLLLRKSCWLTENGCTCSYSYGRFKREKAWQPHSFPEWLSELARKVEAEVGVGPKFYDSCNANLYETDTQILEQHSDNEPLFREAEAPAAKRCVSIASLSFGQTRRFTILKKYGTKKDGAECAIRDGDLLTMEGLFQDNFTHGIGAYDPSIELNGSTGGAQSSNGPGKPSMRINLTSRHMHQRAARCKCRR